LRDIGIVVGRWANWRTQPCGTVLAFGHKLFRIQQFAMMTNIEVAELFTHFLL